MMSLGMAADWKSVLSFNAHFLLACENQQMSFVKWSVIKAWHEHHLESMHMQAVKPGGGGANSNNNNNNGGAGAGAGNGDGDSGLKKNKKKKDNPNFMPDVFIHDKHLCFRFQRGMCEHKENHPIGTTTLVDTCSLCLYKDHSLNMDHGSKDCPMCDMNFSKQGGAE
jgi:hypothetical protein